MQGLTDRVCARPDIDDFYWENEKVPTPILDTIENPLCLKNLSLKVICKLFSIFIFIVLVLHHLYLQSCSILYLNNCLFRN